MTWYQNGIMRQQTLNGWKAREAARKQSATKAPASTPSAKGQPKPKQVGTSNFIPQAEPILPAILAEQQASSPDERRALDRYYRVNLDYVARQNRARQRPLNDIAVALASYLQISYAVARDEGEPLLNPTQSTAFIGELREAIKADQSIQALDDRKRQMLYEELLLTAIALSDALDVSKRNLRPEAGKQVMAIARKNVEEFFGVPFGRVRVTANGLEGL
jgi:hypothetical protein